LRSEIAEDVLASARRFGPIRLKVSSMRFLGAGVAYDVTSGELATLRNELAQRWLQHLSQQDRQTFRPHITIQNKVHADTARTLYAQMTDSFEPFDITGTGLQVWRYRGGPWEAAGEYAFSAGSAELPR
jgi:2'-5' RNA ligase